MPTYISLLNWTDEGIRAFKNTVERAKTAGDLAEQMGGKLKDVYWTTGPYDVISVAEFPDDETGTAVLLALGSQGSIRSTTLRAFSEEEFQAILDKAP